jgi:hypothetical protein
MIQNVVRAMGGIAGFGVLSICLFFTVFLAASLFALFQRKSLCDHMGALPLEDGSLQRKEVSNE